MSWKPDILTVAGLRGLPDCCPHWDDDGENPSYCALALGMVISMRGAAQPDGEGGAGLGGRRPYRSAVAAPGTSDEGRQFGTGGYPELGVGLVKVVGDGTGGQEQLGGDIPVS